MNGHMTSGFSQSLYYGVLRHSRLAFVMYHRLRSRFTRSSYDKWYANVVLKGRSPVEAGLQLLSKLQREHGFLAVVLMLPEFSTPFEQYRSGWIHSKASAAVKGLPGIQFIDLLPGFAQLDGSAKSFANLPRDPVHLNEEGHRAMASLLEPVIRNAAARNRRH